MFFFFLPVAYNTTTHPGMKSTATARVGTKKVSAEVIILSDNEDDDVQGSGAGEGN